MVRSDGGPCLVRSKMNKLEHVWDSCMVRAGARTGGGSLYGDFQGIMGNGHLGPP